jgi:hypothetical protein
MAGFARSAAGSGRIVMELNGMWKLTRDMYPEIFDAWMEDKSSIYITSDSLTLYIQEKHPNIYKEWVAMRDLDGAVNDSHTV